MVCPVLRTSQTTPKITKAQKMIIPIHITATTHGCPPPLPSQYITGLPLFIGVTAQRKLTIEPVVGHLVRSMTDEQPAREYGSTADKGLFPARESQPVADQGAQDSCVARGRPGLRMATPAFNRAWRIVSGLTWSSLPIEAQERPEA